MRKNSLKYYMSLPYKVEILQNSDGSYFGKIVELEGCMTEADSIPDLLQMLEDAKKSWLKIALEDDIKIPEPMEQSREYSGQFNLRIPKSLHRDLVSTAKKEEISLNQYIVYLLSKNYYLTRKLAKKGGMKKIK